MQIGLGVLGRSSADFWAMTMPEFQAALEGWLEVRRGSGSAALAPTRAELGEPMASFPD